MTTRGKIWVSAILLGGMICWLVFWAYFVFKVAQHVGVFS